MTVNENLLLKNKVVRLEARLALVERFVELRFSETFRDFTIRNSGKFAKDVGKLRKDEDESGSDDETELPKRKNEKLLSSHVQGSSSSTAKQSVRKGSNKPGPTSSQGKTATVAKKVTRSKNEDPVVKNVSNFSGSRRYGTRRQTQIAQAVAIKTEADIESENDNELLAYGSSNDMESELDGASQVQVENQDEDSYFTYPVHYNSDGGMQGEDDDPLESDNEDANDGNWSGEACDDTSDNDWKQTGNVKRKANKRKGQNCEAEKSVKKKRKGSAKRKSRPVYLNARLELLSEDTRIGNTDPTRGECPICKQHWKLDALEQHIASHTKERHIKCPHCEKTYFKKDDLRNHLKQTHERNKYFPKCRICHVSVVRKMILHEKYCVNKTLMKGGTVDKSLIESIREECAKDGLEFALPDETVPKGMDPEEKLECPHCKRFFQRRYYDRHVNSHSLARNWKCTKCPKAYIHKHDLIRHMCVTHEVTLKCNCCEEEFETRQDLHNHSLKCRKKRGLQPQASSNTKSNNKDQTQNANLPVSTAETDSNSADSGQQEEQNQDEVMDPPAPADLDEGNK